MAVDFPNSPATNDVYTVDLKQWKYDGEKWVIVTVGVGGPVGPGGPTGPSGPLGATGLTGPSGNWTTTQTIRSITGFTDTPIPSDIGKLITIDTASSTVAITINSSLALTAGTRIDFIWLGATTAVTFIASGVTLNGTPGLKLRATYSAASLLCISTGVYVLVGDLSA